MAKKRRSPDAEDPSAGRYRVKSPVLHDNERYEIGELIELEDDVAAPLLGCGAVEKDDADVNDETKKETGEE